MLRYPYSEEIRPAAGLVQFPVDTDGAGADGTGLVESPLLFPLPLLAEAFLAASAAAAAEAGFSVLLLLLSF